MSVQNPVRTVLGKVADAASVGRDLLTIYVEQ